MNLALGIFNLASAVVCICATIRHWHAVRRWEALNDILASIAVRSFVQAHHGTFDAWSRTMGSLNVEITAETREPRFFRQD